MNKSAFLYVLIFSLVLNAAMIGSALSIWWKRPAQASELASESKSVQQFIKEDLRLEPAKSDEILDKINRGRDRIRGLRDNIQALRSELMDAITADNLDPSVIEAKLAGMDKAHVQIRRTGVGILTQTAQLLGPEDRKKFGAYLKDRMSGCGPLGGKGPFGELTGGR